MAPSPAEVLGYIASAEPLERTLERFPGLSRERVRALLREAAVLLSSETAPAGAEPAAAAPLVSAPPPPPGRRPAASRPRKALRVWSDGAARGNPGPAGAGAVLTEVDGSVVARVGKYLGLQTNNHAEYAALLLGLEAALELGVEEVEIFSDSELLVRQLQRVYRVKSPGLKPLFERAVELMGRFRRATLRHVPREQNAQADEMSNRAIDERM